MKLKIMLLVTLIINAIGSFLNMLGILIDLPVLIWLGAIVIVVAFALAMAILIYVLLTI